MKSIPFLIITLLLAITLAGCGETKKTTIQTVIPEVKDNSFGTKGFRKSAFTGTPILIDGRDIDVNENGDLVIAGHFETQETKHKQISVMLMKADGSLIETFGDKGQKHFEYPNNNYGTNVAFQGDKIILGGQQGPYFVLSRIDRKGNFDSSFKSGGYFREDRISKLSSNYITEMLVDASDRIYVSGHTSPNNLFLTRYLPDGEPDTNFGTKGIVHFSYKKPIKGGHLSLSPSGRIMLSGTITQSLKELRSAVIAFSQNGALDKSFGDNGISIISFKDGNLGLFNRGITVDKQGRTIVVSSNNKNSIATRGVIYRLGIDGNQDSSFGNNGFTIIDEGFSLGLFKPAMDADKIVIGGYLRKSLSDTNILIVRLLSTGKLDPSYGYEGKGVIKIGELAEGRDTIVHGDRYYVGGYVIGAYQSIIAASKR